MSKELSDKDIQFLKDLYLDPATGLRGAAALYEEVKKKGLAYNTKTKTGITSTQVKDFYNSLSTTQTTQDSKGYNSFIAERPLQQFQIDLVEMKKKWSNNGFKYCFVCVDVFSKKAHMVPMRSKDKDTSVKAMKECITKIGKPETIYSDQGSEFNNKPFLALLEQNSIRIIFSSDHAPFVESFNNTMKTRMYAYMKAHDTQNWTQALPILLKAYNDTKHSSTKIAPNDVNASNQETARMNMLKRAHIKNYPEVKEGDEVRLLETHKFRKNWDPRFSSELHTVEANEHNGVYIVDGKAHARRDLKVVKGAVVNLITKTKAQAKSQEQANKVGKAQTNPDVRDIAGDLSKKKVASMIAAAGPARSTRSRSKTKL